MSTESNTQAQDNAQDQTGGEDLSVALSGSEGEFVTSEAPKQTLSQGILYLLLLLAIGGGGTYLMYKRQGPAAASAASVETAAAQQTINNFLTTGPNGIKMMEEMLHNTQKIVQQFWNIQRSAGPLEFSTHQPVPLRQSRAERKGRRGCSEKEEGRRTHGRHARVAEPDPAIDHPQRRPQGLHDQHTLYLEGQQVDPFTIEKITPNSVVVKTGVYRFELRMQK